MTSAATNPPGSLLGRFNGARIAARLIRAMMPTPRAGRLRVVLPSGDTVETKTAGPGPEAVIEMHRWRAVFLLFREGEIGLAEAFIEGLWTSPDLDAVFAFGVANAEEVGEQTRGLRLAELANRLRHRRNANTRRGSRRNIALHYDLGNDFYAAWLDAGMNYSSALYETEGETLESAQIAKVRRAVDLLALGGGESVLEIGCGWGSVMQELARQRGAVVTGLSLSREQIAYAANRLAGDRGATPLLQDYRDVEGRFDRIVSIEMLEAVGEDYWPLYFRRLRELLTDSGSVVLQVITISEALFLGYRRKPDFIQRYIFPGGMLPTKTAITEQARAAGFTLAHREFFGLSYAETLAEWRRRFLAAWPRIEAMGFDERFFRTWTYYLAYCEAGFRGGAIDVGFYRLELG